MSDDRRPARRSGSGGGVALGFLLALLVAVVWVFATVAGWVLAALAAVAGVVLVTRRDPFRRGVGSGLLAGLGTLALFFGACFAIISSLE